MTTITIDEAKDHLDELLAKAAEGEEVKIVRDDGSAYTIVPIQAAPPKKRDLIGSMQGKIWMADDFDEIPEGVEPYLGDETTSSEASQGGERSDDVTNPTPMKDRSELFGILKGRVKLAPDFDEIPEGFEPYLGDDVDKTG